MDKAQVEQGLSKELQDIVGMLLRSKFAEVDQKTTDWRINRFVYKWTDEGKRACQRYADATPVGWAEAIRSGHTRHCVVCGRDCYRLKVWAAAGTYRCVCMDCGAKGHGLKDLARNEDECHAAIDIEQAWKDRDAHAQKFRYPKPKYLT